jgi:hypothetical protein
MTTDNMQTLIPNYMRMKIADKDGYSTQDHHNFMTLLTQVLQSILSNEGIKTPQQTTENIGLLNTAQSIGALLYDADTHELKVNINGTFKTVQVV